MYSPGAGGVVDFTRNDPPAFPTDIEHVGGEANNSESIAGVPVEIVHAVSAMLNPLPEMTTVVPAPPIVGESDICAEGAPTTN